MDWIKLPGVSPECSAAPVASSNGHSLSVWHWVNVRAYVATGCLIQLAMKGTYGSKNNKKK